MDKGKIFHLDPLWGIREISGTEMVDLVWSPYGSIPTPEKEFRFHPVRKWRYDYAWPDQKVAVEIDGGIWTQGRHTRGKGALADMEKMNAGVKLGWQIYHFTPQQLRRGEAQAFMKDVLTNKPHNHGGFK